jgi:hypothetical protein
MTGARLVRWLYLAANTGILAGFAMMVQPFLHALFVWGFPVILAGVVIHLVLDHLPARLHEAAEDDNGGPA